MFLGIFFIIICCFQNLFSMDNQIAKKEIVPQEKIDRLKKIASFEKSSIERCRQEQFLIKLFEQNPNLLKTVLC